MQEYHKEVFTGMTAEKIKKLVAQMTLEEKAAMCSGADFWHTEAVARLGIPASMVSDGPHGLRKQDQEGDHLGVNDSIKAVCFPAGCGTAASFNRELLTEMGEALGNECQTEGVSVLLGPAVNIKRSPLCGRNFEYYSEDPYISGIMVSYSAKGAIEKGLYPFVKHFVVADTEPSRNGKYTWLTEQALREIYLKPFEYAVKLGGTTAIMTAYNRVGSVRCSGSYALNTTVLRHEWGFKGMVISDYFAGGNAMDEDEFIRAGNDLKLLPGGRPTDLDDLNSATAVIALQKSAKNILYGYLNTVYTAANAQGLDLTEAIGTKTEPFAWWVIILVALDVAAVGGCGVWGFIVFRKMRKGETE